MESKRGAWSKRLRGLFLDGATSGEERAVMEGYRCGARGDTSKETLRAESPCVGAAVLCRAEAQAPRARTAARGSAQGPEPRSAGAPPSATAPRAAPRPALRPPRPLRKRPRCHGAGPGRAERWALPRHGPTRGGPSAAPLCRCPPPGQTAAARRGAMAAGLGPWLLALALGPAGARRARRAARPGLGAARAAAPRAR